jgi:uncharacterized membrane protein YesL
MKRLLSWHTNLGETGLRLFLLNLLWLGWTLAGGIVLGIFPATAAVYAIVRKDLMRSHDLSSPEREPLHREFRAAWMREFRSANCLGYTFAVIWVLVLFDRRLLGALDLGTVGPVLAGLLWLITAFVFCMTVSVGVLAAHFAENVPALVRRSAVFVLARPVYAGINAALVAVVLCVYYVVPGLAPVFGLAAPVYLSFAYIWSTGVLPDGARGAPAVSKHESREKK